MSFVRSDSPNCEESLNSGDVSSVSLPSASQIPPEKLPSSYNGRNLTCSFSPIIHFCPQNIFTLFNSFERNDSSHPGLILFKPYRSRLFPESSCGQGLPSGELDIC